MKSSLAHEMIDVDALRVGMFVHLDLRWMAHPFPVGNFRIADQDQVKTIRALGVRRIRWSPARSDLRAPVRPQGFAASTAATAAVATAADALPIGTAGPAELAPSSVPASTSASAATAAAAAADEHRRLLAAQRESLAVCEQQFAEAAQDCKRLTDQAVLQPTEMRVQVEQLSTALVDKMLGEQTLCIRLLSSAAGDKATVHALNVTILSLLMGRNLGLSADELRDLGVGALLHDIGKLDLPERVRHDDEHFGLSERRSYEEHVALGVRQARRMGLSPGATLVVAQHHEQADGGGFPLRLQSDNMTIAARIVAMVNRYDNLCNNHLAHWSVTPAESLSLLFARSPAQFDTSLLASFIRMMGVYPAGSVVQLTDNRHALVVSINASRPLRPRVLVYEPGVPRADALILDLEANRQLGIRRSLPPAQLEPAALDYLAPRTRLAYFFESSPTTLPGAQEGQG